VSTRRKHLEGQNIVEIDYNEFQVWIKTNKDKVKPSMLTDIAGTQPAWTTETVSAFVRYKL